MSWSRALLAPIAVVVLFSGAGCGSGDAGACNMASLPTAYVSVDHELNAATERAVRAQLKALTQPMKDAEADLTKLPSAAELAALYANGATSLRAITTPYYAAQVDALIGEFASAAGKTYVPSDPPPATGGKFGAYIFSKEGIDLRQVIEKGLFAAALYHHALGLSEGDIDLATLDRQIAIFGAHASFPADDKAATNPDELAASYAERRDPKDAANPGPYLKIKAAFIRANAALAQGAACDAEVVAAQQTIRTEWERAIFGTVVFYLNDVTAKLTLANPTETDRAAALHGYGEIIGFIHGWRTLPADGRVITDAEIDSLLTLLGAPPSGGAVTAYKLLTDTANQLPKLTQALATIADIYDFTPAEIERWKTNL